MERAQAFPRFAQILGQIPSERRFGGGPAIVRLVLCYSSIDLPQLESRVVDGDPSC
jgi:hypothetical protein